MKLFFKNLFGMLAATAALLLLSLALYLAAARISSILPSKDPSVNTESEKKSVTVILDAGHGGIDGGAVGVGGTLEKDINLAIAEKTEERLLAKGISVKLTRKEDALLDDQGSGTRKLKDLRARAALVNNEENAILVSLHQNRFPDPAVSGMTFYYSENHDGSLRLAEALHGEMLLGLQPDNRRPMKAATSSIYLLYHTHVPAVMIECGFLSNALEEAKLASEAYQDAIADMIVTAVCRYLEESENQP